MITPVKIIEIRQIPTPVELIDVETDGNHLFFVNGMLSHNSAVSATQHTHEHIAGGISKINESDVYWSIVMSETMKASGQICFTMQKTRNSDGVGQNVHLKWDKKYLRIRDIDDISPINKQSSVDDTNNSNSQNSTPSLLDFMKTLS